MNDLPKPGNAAVEWQQVLAAAAALLDKEIRSPRSANERWARDGIEKARDALESSGQ